VSAGDEAPIAALPAPPLGSVLDFLRLVWGVDHGLQKMSKRMQRTMGVTGPQRLVLRLIARFPGLTVGRLAELLQVHPSTVTGILKRLEQRGLIGRRADTRDRRRAYLGLTASGRRLDAQLEGTVEAAVQRALWSLSPAALRHARQALMALARELRLAGASQAAAATVATRRRSSSSAPR
jgi:MarR family transcriptional regulator, organic hydroperoxide resistance regulator